MIHVPKAVPVRHSLAAQLLRGWLFAAVALVSIAPVQAAAQSIKNVHRSSAGIQGNANADPRPAISADGRYVCFGSAANNLVPGDTNARSDVFVHDVVSGTMTLISKSYLGGPANQGSPSGFGVPSISPNGRFVVFDSYATNLIQGDFNGQTDVFRHDRDVDGNGIFDEPGGTFTAIVSRNWNLGESDGTSIVGNIPQQIDDSGDRIVFSSSAANLVFGDSNGLPDCFLHVLSTGEVARVSVATGGTEGNGGSRDPVISGDGNFVAFGSDATSFDLTDTNGVQDVYLHELSEGSTVRVSVPYGLQGGQANGECLWPSISGDGGVVVFTGFASNLVFGDTNDGADVFLRDRLAETTLRVSVSSSGAQCSGGAAYGIITRGMQFTGFIALDETWFDFDTNGWEDTYLRDNFTGETRLISRGTAGWSCNSGVVRNPAVSEGGRVAFASHSTDLTASDSNGFDFDVFLFSPEAVSVGGSPGPAASTLTRAAPNPFRDHITLSFVAVEPGRARVTVHDLSGATVATLLDEFVAAGSRTLAWNGRSDREARPIPPGVYFFRAVLPGSRATQRIIRIR